ncbi:MAG: Gfo/Idh/MocA family oxidoreductase, partial [Clostridia bacterium]|nr:Gfo/Idh/MocA family oxidoreductase [Clostridia bacterium]
MLNAVIIGCGGRGQIFAEYAKQHPEEMKVLAIADKKDFLREKMKKEYGIEDKYVFPDYKELFSKGKIGDVIFIATQDNQHIEPALMALDAGYKNL